MVRNEHGAILGVERWLPVVGYEGAYEVSDRGRVRSLDRRDRLDRMWHGTMLTPSSKGNAPHLKVELSGRGRRVTRLVHHLVLEAFVGPRPMGMETRHLDGDATNNDISNIRWGTRGENNLDRVAHGTHHQANKTHCPMGHRLVEPNIVPSEARRGRRACLACSRAQSWAKYYSLPVTQDLADSYYEQIGVSA